MICSVISAAAAVGPDRAAGKGSIQSHIDQFRTLQVSVGEIGVFQADVNQFCPLKTGSPQVGIGQVEAVSDNGATVIESATSEMVSIADTVRQASATVSRLGTQSAQEIAAMIERIQADANAAVTDMKAGVEQVDIGVELAGKAGTSIRDIKQGSSRVGQAVNGIADALREQTASSHDIAQNMENIAQQVERNHGQTMQTSEAAANIKQLIVVLRKTIAHFRL